MRLVGKIKTAPIVHLIKFGRFLLASLSHRIFSKEPITFFKKKKLFHIGKLMIYDQDSIFNSFESISGNNIFNILN